MDASPPSFVVNMLQIVKGATNNPLVVTVTSESILETSDYTWMLTSLASGATVAFYAQDISQATIRYNKFLVSEVGPSAVDYQDGKIHLSPTGLWKYEIYEMGPTVPHNLDITQAVKMVEVGEITVIGATTEDFPSFSGGDNSVIPVFQG